MYRYNSREVKQYRFVKLVQEIIKSNPNRLLAVQTRMDYLKSHNTVTQTWGQIHVTVFELQIQILDK